MAFQPSLFLFGQLVMCQLLRDKIRMTPLEAILKIKAMFAEAGVDVAVPVAEPVAVEPAVEPIEAAKEYKLKSGVTVVVDKLEIGGKVEVKGEDGQLSPAPAGEHELADGMIIILDESSVIAEIKQPEAEPAAEVEIEVEAPAGPSEAELMKKKIEEMQKELEDMKKKQSMSEASAAKFSKAVEDLTDIVISLMQTPSVEPTEAPKEKFNKHTESYTDKVSKFLDLAKSLKK